MVTSAADKCQADRIRGRCAKFRQIRTRMDRSTSASELRFPVTWIWWLGRLVPCFCFNENPCAMK
jgi:hypothetical protein